MSKRKRYSPEYKHELVELVRRSTSSCRKIALEVGVSPALLPVGCGRLMPGDPRPSLAGERQGMRNSPAPSASWRG